MSYTTRTDGHLLIDERPEAGLLRLVLFGELDIASAPVLRERIDQLRGHRAVVRLDLSNLDFIDSSGLHAIVEAVLGQGEGDWLQIDAHLSPQAERLFRITQADRLVLGQGRASD